MATTKVIKDLLASDSGWSTSSESGLKMPSSNAAYSGPTAEEGMMRNEVGQVSESSASTMQHYNGTDWKNFVNTSQSFAVDFLVIAGGASGAAWHGGGGGAGGYRTSYGTVSPITLNGGTMENELALSLSTNYTITVGDGANGVGSSGPNIPGNAGSNSVFSGSDITDVTSTGGGFGTSIISGTPAAGSGGSGGGGNNTAGGAAVTTPVIQGHAGGTGIGNSGNAYSSGGGGGAKLVGGNASGNTSGSGGDGLENQITGTTGIFYAGGGGGGVYTGGFPGSGGSGGGGNGGPNTYSNDGFPGARNTGSGGGGANASAPQTTGSGGSGIVILRYPTASVSSYAVTGTLDTLSDASFPVTNEGLYQFNGNLNDSSGNGNNISLTGSVTYATGFYGQSAVLGTQATSLSTNIVSALAQTWSVWVKMPSSIGTGARIVNSLNSGGDAGQFIDYNSSNVLTICDIVGGATFTAVNVTVALGTEWHNIVNVNNTTQSLMYLDGVLIATNPAAQSNLQNGNTVRFGRGLYGNAIVGMEIDQSRIIDSALSASDVKKLYNEGQIIETTDGSNSILQFKGGTGTVTFS